MRGTACVRIPDGECHILQTELPDTMKANTAIVFVACLIIAGMAIGVVVTRLAPDDVSLAPVPGNLTKGIVLDTHFPESPETIPIYKVTNNTVFFIGSPRLMEIKTNIPSEDEALFLAEKVLDQYGGLPADAVLRKVERVTMKEYNSATGMTGQEYPQWTQVIYTRQVAGLPVVGPGAEITVGLGENGEVLQFDKVWRTLQYDRDIPIISAEEAFDKLKKRELVEIPQSSLNGLIVSDIRLGYYAEDRDHDQEYYNPVWIFYGTTHPEIDRTLYPYIVDARETDEIQVK